MKMKSIAITFILIIPIIFFTGCRKFIEIDPPRTDLVRTTVFDNDATATAAIIDIYYNMSRSGFCSGAISSFTFLGALSSDELVGYTTGAAKEFYENTLTPQNGSISNSWNQLYSFIYKANAIIDGLSHSNGVSALLKKQLEGEAKFIRAFCHFYLLNLWGDIPLIHSTDYVFNANTLRTTKTEVYQQIILDLQGAQQLLADDYSYSGAERTRPNKWAATALLSRVYLYMEDWVNAESEATNLINKTTLYGLVTNLNSVFLKNSTEAIWQFKSSPSAGNYPNDLLTFYLFSAPPTGGALRSEFVNSFSAGDQRRTAWVKSIAGGGNTYYFPSKYQSLTANTEYSTILRLAEVFLVRAEARTKQNKLSGINSAESDLNRIRSRASLTPVVAVTQDQMLNAIVQERMFELFTEWGHRWLDLKRWNKAQQVLTTLKSPNWQNTDVLYPIPEYQILNSPIGQNPGY